MRKAPLLLLLSCITLAAYAQPGQGKPGEPHEPQSIFNWLTITSALLSIAALVLTFLMYRNLARLLNSVGRRKVDIKILQDEVAEIKSRVVQQISTGTAPVAEKKVLEDRLIQLEKRIISLEDLPRTFELSVPPPEKLNTAPQNNSQRKYAKLPDLLNGFSNEVLQDQQNGEQIYELNIDGERGTFGISNDAAAQKFALSDYQYYLANGCTLANQPVKNARISVSEPGTLTRSGNGWTIEKKAVITFN